MDEELAGGDHAPNDADCPVSRSALPGPAADADPAPPISPADTDTDTDTDTDPIDLTVFQDAVSIDQLVLADQWATAADRRPGLAGITRLAVTDFARVDARARLEALVDLEAHRAWLDGLQQDLLAMIARADQSSERWCQEEVGAALRLSPRTAQTRLQNAAQLADRLPRVHAALRAGRISSQQATAIAETSFELPVETLPDLQRRALAQAADQSLQQTKTALRRAVICLDPQGAARRHSAARAERDVRISDAGNGMAWLSALLPGVAATACYQQLDGDARRRRARRHISGDDRTLAQHRADGLVHRLLNGNDKQAVTVAGPSDAESAGSAGNSATGPASVASNARIEQDVPPVRTRSDQRSSSTIPVQPSGSTASDLPSIRPVVSVIVSADTLLGRDNEPGWLDSYGPITAEVARELAHDTSGTWRRLVTDPVSGQLLDHGTTRYRPPAAVRALVVHRDGTCTFPHCTHRAEHNDLDHIVPFPQGRTAPENLHPPDRRHHNAKTHAGWTVSRDPVSGTTTWTSPLGRAHPTRPPQRWTLPGDQPAVAGHHSGHADPIIEPDGNTDLDADSASASASDDTDLHADTDTEPDANTDLHADSDSDTDTDTDSETDTAGGLDRDPPPF